MPHLYAREAARVREVLCVVLVARDVHVHEDGALLDLLERIVVDEFL